MLESSELSQLTNEDTNHTKHTITKHPENYIEKEKEKTQLSCLATQQSANQLGEKRFQLPN